MLGMSKGQCEHSSGTGWRQVWDHLETGWVHCWEQVRTGMTGHDHWTLVQWSEDVIKADPFFRRSRVRFRVPPLGFEHNCT